MFAGTDYVAVLHVLGRHPRGEWRDRLIAEKLLDGARDEVGVSAHQLPLLGIAGEEADAMGQLRLGRINASRQDVHDQVEALVVGEPVTLVGSGEEG